MPATVYQRLTLKKDTFSRKDIRKIANWVNAIWRKEHEEEPPKVEQTEGERTFMVFSYPDEMIETMDTIVDKYFKNKDYVARKHQEYLDSLADKTEDKGKKPAPRPGQKKPFNKDFKPRGQNSGSQGKPFNKFSKDRQPFSPQGDRPFNRNRDGNREGYNRDFNKDSQRDPNKPFNRDYNRDGNREGYNRDYNKDSQRDPNKPFSRDFKKDYNKDYSKDPNRSYNRDDKKDFNRDHSRDFNKEKSHFDNSKQPHTSTPSVEVQSVHTLRKRKSQD